jgi:hypothetical protein
VGTHGPQRTETATQLRAGQRPAWRGADSLMPTGPISASLRVPPVSLFPTDKPDRRLRNDLARKYADLRTSGVQLGPGNQAMTPRRSKNQPSTSPRRWPPTLRGFHYLGTENLHWVQIERTEKRNRLRVLAKLIKRSNQPSNGQSILQRSLQDSSSKQRLRDNNVKGGKAVCAHASTLDRRMRLSRNDQTARATVHGQSIRGAIRNARNARCHTFAAWRAKPSQRRANKP